MNSEIAQSLIKLYEGSLNGVISTCCLCAEVNVALSVTLNSHFFPRDVITLALTSMRQHFIGGKAAATISHIHQPSIEHIYESVITLLLETSDRFVIIASRDLLIAIQCFLLPQQALDQLCNQSHLLELLSDAFHKAVEKQKEAVVVALIEIPTQFFSKIYRVSNDPDVTKVRHSYLNMLKDWCCLLPTLPTHDLVNVATLRCLRKVIKLSRIEDCHHELLFVTSLLKSDWLASVVCADRLTFWQHYVRVCSLALQAPLLNRWSSQEEEYKLSQWILKHFSVKLVEEAPIPLPQPSGDRQELLTHGNMVHLRSSLHLTILAISILSGSVQNDAKFDEEILQKLATVCDIVRERLHQTDTYKSMSLWFFHVFLDQDDTLAECLLSLLHLYTSLDLRNSELSEKLKFIDPWQLFISLLAQLSNDHLVLLDLLLAPETVFLDYFLALLHYAISQSICLHSPAIDDDLDTQSVGPPECRLLTLTPGLESLMAYDDEDCSPSSSPSGSRSSADGSPSPHELAESTGYVWKVLTRLHSHLVDLHSHNRSPFNVTPVIKLLAQVVNPRH
ncbi:uncharacterized protein [Watersipora subatra]|uniref:uncharacterized protein n=1 Tax=Watersipora subatra TaxID=2589382 RepID=UPI00355B756E